jgi:hypothetical protein
MHDCNEHQSYCIVAHPTLSHTNTHLPSCRIPVPNNLFRYGLDHPVSRCHSQTTFNLPLPLRRFSRNCSRIILQPETFSIVRISHQRYVHQSSIHSYPGNGLQIHRRTGWSAGRRGIRQVFRWNLVESRTSYCCLDESKQQHYYYYYY